MIGIYFSGTGNSKYILDVFLRSYDQGKKARSQFYTIEEPKVTEAIRKNEEIVFSYPVQFSNVPKIVQDFIVRHAKLWKRK